MIKAEWGTKRSCPKCATRFYDLTKEDPITCINCGYAWLPESVLKSKQPMPFEQVVKPGVVPDVELAADDLDLDVDVDENADSPDNDVDLGGDDDLGVETSDGADEEH
jgi:hypothetical protein